MYVEECKCSRMLKPCPFCGGEARVLRSHRYPRNSRSGNAIIAYTPVCTNMDCIIYHADNSYFKTIKAACGAWNGRADELIVKNEREGL